MMNNCTFVGRITHTPELKQLPSGKYIMNFSIAVQRDGKDSKADFISATAWDKSAEAISKYFRKGDRIYIQGPLMSDTYKGQDGNKKTKYFVNVRGWDFIEKKSDRNEQSESSIDVEIDSPEDMPF